MSRSVIGRIFAGAQLLADGGERAARINRLIIILILAPLIGLYFTEVFLR